MQDWGHRAGTVALLTVLYALIDTALNRFAFSDGWTIIWPLNGINVALLLMSPRARWAWILAGIELGTGIGESIDHNSFDAVVGQRVCSLIEVLLTACLLPAFSTLDQWLRAPRVFVRFAVALLVGPGVSGALAAALFHVSQGTPFLLGFNDWATADALGIAATMPLALSIDSPQMRGLFARPRLPRSLGVLTLAFLGAAVIFSESRYPLAFLLYPLLLLVDSLLGFAGSAIAVVGVCLISVYFTTNARGPFGTWPADLAVSGGLALQIYFGFTMLALFPASLMFMERRRMAEELRLTNERLIVLASRDGLTGLANRRAFDERFATEWNRAIRARTPLALAMIDLDNFKQYNDLYGHLAGDRCLCAVGAALEAQIQRPEDLIARFGGEEFSLLMPHTEAEGAATLGERIRAAVAALGIDHLGNPWGHVTVSIGHAVITPLPNDDRSRLFQLADAALYQAKSAGRNRVETLASVDGLAAANDHGSATQRNRVLRMLSRGDR